VICSARQDKLNVICGILMLAFNVPMVCLTSQVAG